jgi:hypothetical protein
MDKAITFGRHTLLFRFTTGFGLYVETVPTQLRPALVQYDPDDDELDMTMVEYSATALKLPLLTIELGRFNPILFDEDAEELNKLIREMLEEQEAEDDEN